MNRHIIYPNCQSKEEKRNENIVCQHEVRFGNWASYTEINLIPEAKVNVADELEIREEEMAVFLLHLLFEGSMLDEEGFLYCYMQKITITGKLFLIRNTQYFIWSCLMTMNVCLFFSLQNRISYSFVLYFWTYWYYKNIKFSFYFMFHHIGRNCWITLTDMFQISISCCCTIFILFCFVFVFNHYQNNRLLEPIIPFRWLLLRKVDYIILEKQCILLLTDVNGK